MRRRMREREERGRSDDLCLLVRIASLSVSTWYLHLCILGLWIDNIQLQVLYVR